MSECDVLCREFMSDPQIFAEAFNFYLYRGEEVIKPEDLKECDTKLVHSSNKKQSSIWKERDIFKEVYRDENHIYLVLGIENQASIDYWMPLRIMLYDVLSYISQMQNKTLQNAFIDAEKPNQHHRQRLLPVITLVINYSLSAWTGPKTLHELMGNQPKDLLKFVPDYPLFVLDPHKIKSSELAMMKSELGCVCKCLKYCRNRSGLKKMVKLDSRFKSLSKTAAKLLNQRLNLGIKIDNREPKEKCNMCQAIEEMKAIAEKRGEKRGEKLGAKQGNKEGRLLVAKNLLQQTDMTIKAIAASTELTQREIKQIAAELSKESLNNTHF